MAYDFHYTPTGTGVISGKEVLEQTEDAINDLGNTAISGVQEALDKAEQALTNSENAVDDAQTALNTANNAKGVAIQAQTDVSNLSGTVTNIGNRVTTAEGNISNLQGRMTTAEGNITNLQGRMTTAETNIGNLQTAVSTAQATANSAQQTATTARQQSYVFRYSGTAVVPNSTIAYSTIDNTDNIKAGDKILDVDGKLFEITAVDTTNQTVTVGSALIDLALDANVVHTSGNETVGGKKTFTDEFTASRNATNGVIVLQNASYDPKTNGQGGVSTKSFSVNFVTALSDTFGAVSCYGVNDRTILRFTSRYFVDSQTVTEDSVEYNVYGDGSRSFKPRSNNNTMLGETSRCWKSVYATRYYYGSDNVEFSTKFVTSDTAQTITGNKNFSSDLYVANTDTTANTPNLILRNYKADRGTTDTAVQTIMFSDKNAKALTLLESRRINNGNTATNILCYNTNANNATVSGGVAIIKSQTETNFAPNADNAVTCGRALAKWSDVQTYLINSLTPSSLGMPTDNIANIIDISGYLTVLDGSQANTYQAPDNGYIGITMNNCTGIQAYITGFWGNQIVRPTAGGVRFFMPICKNMTANILVFGGTIDNARFFPCQGNI